MVFRQLEFAGRAEHALAFHAAQLAHLDEERLAVVAGRHGDRPVDTGFIVFNHATYPHFSRLLRELEVPIERSDMSFAASLDHTVWFHRPVRMDQWHLFDFSCHSYVGARGVSVGHVFTTEGDHVATVAQEVLIRRRDG